MEDKNGPTPPPDNERSSFSNERSSFSNKDGIVEQPFVVKSHTSGSENLHKDAKTVASWVKGLFTKATNNKDVKTLGMDKDRKEGTEVYTADMGHISTEAVPPAIPTKPEEPPSKTYGSLEDWAKDNPGQAENLGKTDNENNGTNSGSLEDWAKAHGKEDEYKAAARNQDLADQFAKNTSEQQAGFVRTQTEAEESRTPKTGSADASPIDRVKYEEMADAIASGPTSPNEDKERSDHEKSDKNTSEETQALLDNSPIFNDQPETSRLETSDRNPSVIAAEEDVTGHLRMNEANRQADQEADKKAQAERQKMGEGWIAAAHKDNTDATRLENSDKNPSVIEAENDVTGHLRLNEQNQKADRQERESMGQRWSAMDEQESPGDRARRQAQGQVDQAAIGEVDNELADQAAGRIVDHADQTRIREEEKAFGDHWNNLENDRPYPTTPDGQPIRPEVTGVQDLDQTQPAEAPIIEAGAYGVDADIQRMLDENDPTRFRTQTLDREAADPAVQRQREAVRRRTRGIGLAWRRGAVIAGLVGLGLFLKDRGPANPVYENPGGTGVKVEAPSVPMPEIKSDVRSPLDNVPKAKLFFPTEGPTGENIPTDRADLIERFNAEWVKQYKLHNPDQFSDHNYDMRNMYDVNLLKKLEQSDEYKNGSKEWLDYITTHESRGGDKSMTFDVQRDSDGNITKILVDAPNNKGIDVPSIEATYNLFNPINT